MGRASFIFCAVPRPTSTNGAASIAGTRGARFGEPDTAVMLDPQDAWPADVPAALQSALGACVAEDLPANVAAMRLLMASSELGEAERALVQVIAHRRGSAHAGGSHRLQAILEVLRANPQAWHT